MVSKAWRRLALPLLLHELRCDQASAVRDRHEGDPADGFDEILGKVDCMSSWVQHFATTKSDLEELKVGTKSLLEAQRRIKKVKGKTRWPTLFQGTEGPIGELLGAAEDQVQSLMDVTHEVTARLEGLTRTANKELKNGACGKATVKYKDLVAKLRAPSGRSAKSPVDTLVKPFTTTMTTSTSTSTTSTTTLATTTTTTTTSAAPGAETTTAATSAEKIPKAPKTTTAAPVAKTTTEAPGADTTTETPGAETTTAAPAAEKTPKAPKATTAAPVAKTTTEEPGAETTIAAPAEKTSEAPKTTTAVHAADTTTEAPGAEATTTAPAAEKTSEAPKTTTAVHAADTTTEEPGAKTTKAAPAAETTAEAPGAKTTIAAPAEKTSEAPKTTTAAPAAETTAEAPGAKTTTVAPAAETPEAPNTTKAALAAETTTAALAAETTAEAPVAKTTTVAPAAETPEAPKTTVAPPGAETTTAAPVAETTTAASAAESTAEAPGADETTSEGRSTPESTSRLPSRGGSSPATMLIVRGIKFTLLQEHPELLSAFQSAMQDSISKAAAECTRPESITVALGPVPPPNAFRSVTGVNFTIVIPRGADFSCTEALCGTSFKRSVAKNVYAIPSISLVTTGLVRVIITCPAVMQAATEAEGKVPETALSTATTTVPTEAEGNSSDEATSKVPETALSTATTTVPTFEKEHIAEIKVHTPEAPSSSSVPNRGDNANAVLTTTTDASQALEAPSTSSVPALASDTTAVQQSTTNSTVPALGGNATAGGAHGESTLCGWLRWLLTCAGFLTPDRAHSAGEHAGNGTGVVAEPNISIAAAFANTPNSDSKISYLIGLLQSLIGALRGAQHQNTGANQTLPANQTLSVSSPLDTPTTTVLLEEAKPIGVIRITDAKVPLSADTTLEESDALTPSTTTGKEDLEEDDDRAPNETDHNHGPKDGANGSVYGPSDGMRSVHAHATSTEIPPDVKDVDEIADTISNEVIQDLKDEAKGQCTGVPVCHEEAGPATPEGLHPVSCGKLQQKVDCADKISAEEVEAHGHTYNVSDKTFDKDLFRITCLWDGDVDLDLRLELPSGQGAEAVYWDSLNIGGFSLDVDDRGNCEGKHAESISFKGDTIPDGHYKAVIQYFSGDPTNVKITATLKVPGTMPGESKAIEGVIKDLRDVEKLFEFDKKGGTFTTYGRHEVIKDCTPDESQRVDEDLKDGPKDSGNRPHASSTNGHGGDEHLPDDGPDSELRPHGSKSGDHTHATSTEVPPIVKEIDDIAETFTTTHEQDEDLDTQKPDEPKTAEQNLEGEDDASKDSEHGPHVTSSNVHGGDAYQTGDGPDSERGPHGGTSGDQTHATSTEVPPVVKELDDIAETFTTTHGQVGDLDTQNPDEPNTADQNLEDDASKDFEQEAHGSISNTKDGDDHDMAAALTLADNEAASKPSTTIQRQYDELDEFGGIAGSNDVNQGLDDGMTSTRKPSAADIAASIGKDVKEGLDEKTSTRTPSAADIADSIGKDVKEGLDETTSTRKPSAADIAASIGKDVKEGLDETTEVPPEGKEPNDIAETFTTTNGEDGDIDNQKHDATKTADQDLEDDEPGDGEPGQNGNAVHGHATSTQAPPDVKAPSGGKELDDMTEPATHEGVGFSAAGGQEQEGQAGGDRKENSKPMASHMSGTAVPVCQEEAGPPTKEGIHPVSCGKVQQKIDCADKICAEEIDANGHTYNVSDKAFDKNVFRITCLWDGDVDLDLRLELPSGQEAEAVAVGWNNQQYGDFSLDVDDRGNLEGKHAESISFKGDALPDGHYKAVIKYFSGDNTNVKITAALKVPGKMPGESKAVEGVIKELRDAEKLFEFVKKDGTFTTYGRHEVIKDCTPDESKTADQDLKDGPTDSGHGSHGSTNAHGGDAYQTGDGPDSERGPHGGKSGDQTHATSTEVPPVVKELDDIAETFTTTHEQVGDLDTQKPDEPNTADQNLEDDASKDSEQEAHGSSSNIKDGDDHDMAAALTLAGNEAASKPSTTTTDGEYDTDETSTTIQRQYDELDEFGGIAGSNDVNQGLDDGMTSTRKPSAADIADSSGKDVKEGLDEKTSTRKPSAADIASSIGKDVSAADTTTQSQYDELDEFGGIAGSNDVNQDLGGGMATTSQPSAADIDDSIGEDVKGGLDDETTSTSQPSAADIGDSIGEDVKEGLDDETTSTSKPSVAGIADNIRQDLDEGLDDTETKETLPSRQGVSGASTSSATVREGASTRPSASSSAPQDFLTIDATLQKNPLTHLDRPVNVSLTYNEGPGGKPVITDAKIASAVGVPVNVSIGYKQGPGKKPILAAAKLASGGTAEVKMDPPLPKDMLSSKSPESTWNETLNLMLRPGANGAMDVSIVNRTVTGSTFDKSPHQEEGVTLDSTGGYIVVPQEKATLYMSYNKETASLGQMTNATGRRRPETASLGQMANATGRRRPASA